MNLPSGVDSLDSLHRHSTTDATTTETVLYKDRVTSVLGAASYQLATAAGVYTDTYTGSASQNWAMVAAAFKPAPGTATQGTYFVHTDHLGSTNVLTNEDGEVAEVSDYYPYGEQGRQRCAVCGDPRCATERKVSTGKYQWER